MLLSFIDLLLPRVGIFHLRGAGRSNFQIGSVSRFGILIKSVGVYAVTSQIIQSVLDYSKYNIYFLCTYRLVTDNIVSLARVSGPEQKANGYSLLFQEVDLAEFARERNLTVHPVSEGVANGRDLEREGLQEAVSLAKELKCPLMVRSLDRLVRPYPPTQEALSKIRDFGIPIITFEPLTLSAKELQDRQKKRGKAYKRLNRPGERQNRPEYLNLEALSFIIERLGNSWRSIAIGLNLAGIPTQTGKRWDHSTARGFFRRHFRYVNSLVGK